MSSSNERFTPRTLISAVSFKSLIPAIATCSHFSYGGKKHARTVKFFLIDHNCTEDFR